MSQVIYIKIIYRLNVFNFKRERVVTTYDQCLWRTQNGGLARYINNAAWHQQHQRSPMFLSCCKSTIRSYYTRNYFSQCNHFTGILIMIYKIYNFHIKHFIYFRGTYSPDFLTVSNNSSLTWNSILAQNSLQFFNLNHHEVTFPVTWSTQKDNLINLDPIARFFTHKEEKLWLWCNWRACFFCIFLLISFLFIHFLTYFSITVNWKYSMHISRRKFLHKCCLTL